MFAHAEPGMAAIKADATKATVSIFEILFIVNSPFLSTTIADIYP
jgi:hypothetical protein